MPMASSAAAARNAMRYMSVSPDRSMVNQTFIAHNPPGRDTTKSYASLAADRDRYEARPTARLHPQ
jgi:hypothetical protein